MAIFLVGASSDDANEVVSSGAMNLTDTGDTGTVAQLDGTNHGGFRFTNITFAQGVQITSAIFKFEQLRDESGTGTLSQTTIYGHDVDDSGTFTTTASDISGRARTTASLAGSSIAADSDPIAITGVDITAIVQEILDRAGWVSGNDMSILFIGSGTSGNFIKPYMWDYFTGFYQASLEISVEPPHAGTLSIKRPEVNFDKDRRQYAYPHVAHNPLVIPDPVTKKIVWSDSTSIVSRKRTAGY